MEPLEQEIFINSEELTTSQEVEVVKDFQEPEEAKPQKPKNSEKKVSEFNRIKELYKLKEVLIDYKGRHKSLESKEFIEDILSGGSFKFVKLGNKYYYYK